MANSSVLEQLERHVQGRVIAPEDADYDDARRVYNGMIDRRPGVIVRAASVADVVASLCIGEDAGLAIAIRGAGHNAGGLGICDDGLVIDLGGLRSVRVDARARTARVEGGCVWGEVDRATHSFGLAVPSGIVSTTGVGGLTLGGGTGHLTRRFGLTVDNLLSADVVRPTAAASLRARTSTRICSGPCAAAAAISESSPRSSSGSRPSIA